MNGDLGELTYRNSTDSVGGRRKYWELGRVTYPVIRAPRSGAAHVALAELHRLDRLDCCITRNIDGLHQRAGLLPDKVIELHGNATHLLPRVRGRLHARRGADARADLVIRVKTGAAMAAVVEAVRARAARQESSERPEALERRSAP